MARPWFLEKEALNWVSLALEFLRIVTWEFGTKISQLEQFFGLQTGGIQLKIPLAC
jgi:hypothetical protein